MPISISSSADHAHSSSEDEDYGTRGDEEVLAGLEDSLSADALAALREHVFGGFGSMICDTDDEAAFPGKSAAPVPPVVPSPDVELLLTAVADLEDGRIDLLQEHCVVRLQALLERCLAATAVAAATTEEPSNPASLLAPSGSDSAMVATMLRLRAADAATTASSEAALEALAGREALRTSAPGADALAALREHGVVRLANVVPEGLCAAALSAVNDSLDHAIASGTATGTSGGGTGVGEQEKRFGPVLARSSRYDMYIEHAGAPRALLAAVLCARGGLGLLFRALFDGSRESGGIGEEVGADESDTARVHELAALISDPGAPRQPIHPDNKHQSIAPLFTVRHYRRLFVIFVALCNCLLVLVVGVALWFLETAVLCVLLGVVVATMVIEVCSVLIVVCRCSTHVPAFARGVHRAAGCGGRHGADHFPTRHAHGRGARALQRRRRDQAVRCYRIDQISLYQSIITVTDSSSTSVTPGVSVGFGSSIIEQTEGLPGRLQVPRRPAAARRRADHGLSPPALRVGQHFGRHAPRLAVYLLPKPALR